MGDNADPFLSHVDDLIHKKVIGAHHLDMQIDTIRYIRGFR